MRAIVLNFRGVWEKLKEITKLASEAEAVGISKTWIRRQDGDLKD